MHTTKGQSGVLCHGKDLADVGQQLSADHGDLVDDQHPQSSKAGPVEVVPEDATVVSASARGLGDLQGRVQGLPVHVAGSDASGGDLPCQQSALPTPAVEGVEQI